MTTPMLMTQHPTEELLAEFVDDRLDSAARPAVTDHLASCGECREIVLMANDYQVSEEPANVTRGNFGGRRWMAAAGLAAAGLAAAAAIAVMVVQPSALFGPNVDDLVAASRSVAKRPSAGRLAGEFAYSDKPSTYRGSSDEESDISGDNAKLFEIRVKLEEEKSPDPHVLGLARLLTAEKNAKDVSDAVSSLETAYGKTRGEERDSIAIDLAAALIAYGRWSQPDQSYARALELSNDVLKRHPKSPAAFWNRATALESLNRDDEALKAWDDYLKIDPSSQWSEEAKQNKARLQSEF